MSNRLTFSLASLILILALGLVFAPTSVMAHDAAQSVGLDGVVGGTDDIPSHTHPVKVLVPAVTSGNNQVAEIPVHGHHPMVTSIALKTDDKVSDNMVEVGAAPGTLTAGIDAHEFVIIVTFDRPVVADAADTDQDDDNDNDIDATDAIAILAVTDISHSVQNKMRQETGITQTDITFKDIKFMGTTYDKFEVTVEAGTTAVPTGMAADAIEKVILRVQVNQSAVHSPQTIAKVNTLAGTVPVPGGASSASNFYEFELVKELPAPPALPDEDPPVVTITAPKMLTDGQAVFTVGFDEALGTGLNGLQHTDFDIDGGSVTEDDLEGPSTDHDYKLKVTPDSDDASITVTLRDNAVTDAMDNQLMDASATGNTPSATYDATPPTVMVTAPDGPDDDGNLTFTFVFSELLDETDEFVTTDISGSGYSIIAMAPKKSKTPADSTATTETWTVKVTPDSADAVVRVGINAGAVKDKGGNPLAAGGSAMYTPPVPTAPGAPTSVTATADQDTDIITISWTAPTDTGTAPITSYTVTQTGQAGASYEGIAADATSQPTGALAAGDYTFTVMAINSVGSSVASAEVMATIDAEPMVLPQPTSVSAEARNDGTVRVTWAWAGSTNALAGFTVMWNGGQNEIGTATARNYTIPEDMLTAGQPTTVRVLARATAGSGYVTPAAGTSATSAVTPVDTEALRFEPGASIDPLDLTAGEEIDAVELPQAYGGKGNYTYTLRKGKGKADITSGDNGLTVDLVNLQLMGTPTAEAEETPYTWQASDGENSIELGFNITVDAAPAPPSAPAAPAGLTAVATANMHGSVTLTWTAVTGMMYEYSKDGGTNWMDATSPQAVTGLTGGTEYTFSVRVKEDTTTSTPAGMAAMAKATPTAAPEVPTAPAGLTATAGDAQVMLSWTASTDASITEYEYSTDGNAWIDIPNSGATTDSHTVTGLTNGRAYTFHVRAVNSAGNGAASMAGPVTLMAPLEKPGPVTGLTATPGDAQVTLNWTKPATGGAVGSYSYSMNNGVTWDPIANSDATTVMHTVTGLTNGQTYIFIVCAENSAGKGDPSNAISSTPMAPPPDTTGPVATITGTQGTARAFTVTITFDEALKAGETLTDAEVAVTGGTIANVAVDTTDAKVYTGTITPNHGVTAVTVQVNAGAVKDASDNANVATPATAQSITVRMTSEPRVTDTKNILRDVSIPAESYIVIARSDVVELPSNVTKVTWNGMPDLENLFFTNGTLNVTRAATPQVDHDDDDASAPRDIGTRDVVITEVMAALNTAKPTNSSERIAHQWIEVYNKLKVEVTGITVSAKSGHPVGFPDGAPTDQVLLDRLSNVVGVGWAFEGLGENGSDDGPGEGTAAEKPFVSFYRNHTGEPGWQKHRWTTSSDVYRTNSKGTPGTKERSRGPVLATDTLNQKPAVINEVGNFPDGSKKYEWIEILVTEGNHRFKNWELEAIEGVDKIKRIVTLPEIPGAQAIGPGKVLLVTNADPADDPSHPLAAGFNVMKGANDQARGVSADHPVKYLVKAFDNELPSGDFVLTLRTRNDRDNQEGLVDVAGYHGNLKVDRNNFFTNLWPLRNFGAPVSDKNKLAEGAVHYRQHTSVPGTGTTHGDKKDDQVAMRDAPWTGVGYKRNAAATAQNGGTPGYPNNALKSEGTDVQNPVIISEIMFDNTRNLPQWIELHNTSKVNGMNIDNWSIFIVNYHLTADGENYSTLSDRIDLDGRIPPGQTYLIVSRRGTSDTRLPAARIHNVNKKRSETMLNPYGFQVTLKAKTNEGDANKHQTIDTVGNLGAVPENNRRRDAQSFADLAWMLPDGTNESGNRVSINRVSTKGMNMDDASAGRIDGTKEIAWVSFDMSAQVSLGTYYGHDSDKGSPGYTTGSILPVSLSKFRPERLKTGEVVVRWITESELNNAGFNILRSDAKDGQFTKVNTQLIKGHGTTSERNTYEFTDTSAKPNVVYYYQIQDVSFDGEVTTLRTTHLRGNVSAAGKATTTWGKLKALQ